MTRTIRRPGNRWLRILGLSLALIAVGGMTGATPALAHGRHHSGHHRKHHKHVRHASHGRATYGYVGEAHRGHFVVPVRIHRHVRTYRPYYWTRVYDPVHRHHHAVYRFPVPGPYGVVYQPHVYCEGRLFHEGVYFSYHGRHVAVSVGF